MSQVDHLRTWRSEAIQQGQYKTAETLADKLLWITKSNKDRFWLAKIAMYRKNQSKAWFLLKDHWSEDPELKLLAIQALFEQEQFDDALQIIESDAEPPQVRQTHRNGTRQSPAKSNNKDAKTKANTNASRILYMQGQIYASKSNFDQAKECYQDACKLDARNIEAFTELVDHQLLGPADQKRFFESLDFSVCGDLADMIMALYKTHLSPYIEPEYFKDAELLLKEHYSLGDGTDVKLCEIRRLCVQARYSQAQAVCESVLAVDNHNLAIMPYYIACLYHEEANNVLFRLAHELTESHADSAVAWLAVGTYYYSVDNNAEARRYFTRASMMKSTLAPAWIGFGHTFAAEKEHEHAIAAYATAERLFPGSHMPNMFLGIQHMMLNNLPVAYEYLNASYAICDSDPLLLNELGVVAFQQGDLSHAESFFVKAVRVADSIGADKSAWISLSANLGHVYRRQGKYNDALECFHQVLSSSSADSQVYTAIGAIYLMSSNYLEAIENFHKALSINNRDQIADEFLQLAMHDMGTMRVL